MGFDISNIKNAALRALAISIDEDKNFQGKDKGKLENGAEMSVFLTKSAVVMFAGDEEVMEEVLTIADSADKKTYEMFKEGFIETINKMKGNVPGFNGFMKILDRMMQRFEKDADKVVTTDIDNKAASGNLIINKTEIQPNK